MKRLLIALIRFYQKHISPLKRRPTCRFYPTCSAYAVEALQKRGFFAGSLLAFLRILRCQPLCPGGYDPVPEHGFRRVKFTEDTTEADASPDGQPFHSESESNPGFKPKRMTKY